MSGIRMVKIANGLRHDYVTQNGKVVRESVYGIDTNTGEYTVFQYVLDFTCDEAGHSLTMRKYNNADMQTDYITMQYVCNAQGDVVKLDYGNGTVYAEYAYDAWGKVLEAKENGNYHYAETNPLRYRGYYYDTETGFYYLQSRYYDPIVKRFLNADSYGSTGQGFLGYNMYAYCGNCPVGHIDIKGNACNTCQMLTDSGTNPQRVLIEELEEYTGYTFYYTQDEAAGAVAEELWARSKETNVEYCSMVYRIDLSLHGGYGCVYYSDSIMRGMHDNVFFQLLWLNHQADDMRGEQVAFVHSHPHCTCHKTNEFSHGDKGVPALASVNSVYLIGQNRKLQRWDKDRTERYELIIQILIGINNFFN